MAAGSPAGFSRTRLLSQIRPAVWFAAQLCTAGSAQPGDGKTWVGAWRGGSLASCPRHREPVAGCVSLPSNSQHTSPFLCPLCPLPLALLVPAAKGTWEPWLWLPGDSAFTDCRLMNPTGLALGHSVCAPLQSDQSYFPTRFLLLGINQSKRAAWTDHRHCTFC